MVPYLPQSDVTSSSDDVEEFKGAYTGLGTVMNHANIYELSLSDKTAWTFFD